MRRIGLCLTAVVVLLASAAVNGSAFPLTVAEITVQGNEGIRQRQILRVVPFAVGDTIVEEDLRKATQAIHDLGWFDEVAWDRDAAAEGRAVFLVREYPVIEEIVITGNTHRKSHSLFGIKLFDLPLMSTMSIRRILSDNEIRRRKVINLPGLTTALEEILEEYQSRGYAVDRAALWIGDVDVSSTLRVEILEREFAGSLITGLRAVPEAVAQDLIQIPIGEPIRLSDLQRSRARLIESIFFSDVGVETQAGMERTQVWLRWKLTERQLIRDPIAFSSVSFEGNTVYDHQELERLLGEIPTGSVGNYELLVLLHGVHDRYMKDGYSLAQIRVVGVEDDRLRLRIDEGLIASLTVEGARHTRGYVVERNVSLVVGEVYRRSDLVSSYQKLTALGYFDNVDIVPNRGDEHVDVLIKVTDKKSLGSFGGSMAVDPGRRSLFGELTLNQKNLFGTGQDIQLSYSRGLINLGDESPSTWNLGYSTVAYFEGFDRVNLDLYQESKRVKVDEEDALHVTLGVGLSFAYPVTAYTNLGIAFRHEEERTTGDAVWTPTDVFSLSLTYDDTNHPAFPTQGSRRRLGFEKAGGFSPGTEYAKVDLTWTHFAPTGVGLLPADLAQTLAIRIMTGFADSGLPESRWTELGGSMSVRGAASMPVQQYVIANLEYRLQLIEGLQVTAFVDTGLDMGQVRLDDVVSSYGMELGFDVAGIMLRLTMAWPSDRDDRWTPVFDLGFGRMF